MNWDYIAGFIDGEGTISINKERRKKKDGYGFILIPRISMANTHKEVLCIIKEFLAQHNIKSNITSHNYYDKERNIKTWYRLMIDCRIQTSKLIPFLEGKLIIKNNRLKTLKQYLEVRQPYARGYTEEDMNMYHTMKLLNKKGKE